MCVLYQYKFTIVINKLKNVLLNLIEIEVTPIFEKLVEKD